MKRQEDTKDPDSSQKSKKQKSESDILEQKSAFEEDKATIELLIQASSNNKIQTNESIECNDESILRSDREGLKTVNRAEVQIDPQNEAISSEDENSDIDSEHWLQAPTENKGPRIGNEFQAILPSIAKRNDKTMDK